MCNIRLYGKIRETIVCSYSIIVCCNLAYETSFYAPNITLSLYESSRASASAIVPAVYCIMTLSGTDMAVFLSVVVASIIRGVIRVSWVRVSSLSWSRILNISTRACYPMKHIYVSQQLLNSKGIWMDLIPMEVRVC